MKIEEFTDLLYEPDDKGVLTLTINCPKRRNAMSVRTLYELRCAAEHFKNDDALKVMIVTGADSPDLDDDKQAFSSGGFFDPRAAESLPEAYRNEIDLQDVAQKALVLKYTELDKPVIAALNGYGIGAGFTFPYACADLIYMTETAFFRFAFNKIGIIPELAMTYLLPRQIGMHKTKELVYFGKDLPAKEAQALGLVNETFPKHELMERVYERALKLIPPNAPYLAIRQTKTAFLKPVLDNMAQAMDDENAGLAVTMQSKDLAEAVIARIEKRQPVFKGE